MFVLCMFVLSLWATLVDGCVAYQYAVFDRLALS